MIKNEKLVKLVKSSTRKLNFYFDQNKKMSLKHYTKLSLLYFFFPNLQLLLIIKNSTHKLCVCFFFRVRKLFCIFARFPVASIFTRRFPGFYFSHLFPSSPFVLPCIFHVLLFFSHEHLKRK